MAADKIPGFKGEEGSEKDRRARHHGRMGLAPSWERIPWWGVIIMIAGIIVGYSMLTNVRYIDAISFIFDLPWNSRALARSPVGESGDWDLRVATPLEPGEYRFYVKFLNELNDPIGRTETFFVQVPEGVRELEVEALVPSPGTTVTVKSNRPAFRGSDGLGDSAVLVDDFGHRPWRVVQRMVLSNGVFLTFRVTVISFTGALFLGLIFGLMRISPSSPDLRAGARMRLMLGFLATVVLLVLNPGWRSLPTILLVLLGVEAFAFLLPAMPYTLSTLYVELVRGIPMLVIVLYMGFAVTPALRDLSANWGLGEIDLRGLPAATIALAFGYGAYLAEVYRAGIESIPRGQMEAARSVGMTYFQAMRYVILPQAIRVVLPPLGNDFIALLKDTSLISVIALPEILQQGRLWISRNFRAFEGYNSVAMLYLIMTLLLSLLVRYIERKAAIEQ